MGSSPLARGARRGHGRPRPGFGIIPARAGCTPNGTTRHYLHKDHPRSRGVHGVDLLDLYRGTGSSPLARGARQAVPVEDGKAGSSPLARGAPPTEFVGAVEVRIIPARAGCTLHRWGLRLRRPDHPRSRGVHPVSGTVRPSEPGSSPLARGARNPFPVRSLSRRIIPARAGCTPEAVIETVAPWGSSPLARGALRRSGSGR